LQESSLPEAGIRFPHASASSLNSRKFPFSHFASLSSKTKISGCLGSSFKFWALLKHRLSSTLRIGCLLHKTEINKNKNLDSFNTSKLKSECYD